MGKRCDACAEKLRKARSEAQRQCIKKIREKHKKKQSIPRESQNTVDTAQSVSRNVLTESSAEASVVSNSATAAIGTSDTQKRTEREKCAEAKQRWARNLRKSRQGQK